MRKKILLFIICCSLVGGAWVLEDNNNPYDFTVTKPALQQIVGEYRISEKSRKRLDIPENIAETILIKLNSNKTFEFINMPKNEPFKNLSEFKTTNEKGIWDINKDQGSWVLYITIISKYDGNKTHLANQYHLNKNKPPYQILKMVGNDNWEAIMFDKK
ncbi:hypothetical protein [Winogradskyella sp.]|uniref:hypothetical protein n=2 Tax=Winogradskyella sp. TaxID=1883156 RepID=UPI00351504D7